MTWLKAVGPTQLVAGVAVAVVFGVGGYYTVDWALSDDSLSETEQEYIVSRGNLSETVSTNGTLRYVNSAQLKFPTEGTLASLLVEEGETVEEGQTLASLDDATIADLERNLAEAELALEEAEAEYETASKPAEGLALAEAKAAVANARLDVNNAEFELAEVEAGLNSPAVVAAQTNVDSAEDDFNAAVSDLEAARDEWNSKVEEAQNDAESAIVGYERAVESWFGPMDGVDLSVAPSVLIDRWDTTYTEIWGSRPAATRYDSIPSDNPDTPWDEYTLWVWDSIYPGEVQAVCANDYDGDARCIKKQLEDAWDARIEAQQSAASVNADAQSAINTAQAKVNSTQSALTNARQTLNNLLSPATLEARQAELDSARAKLEQAEEDLAKAQQVDDRALRIARANLTRAQTALEQAQEARQNGVLTAPFVGEVHVVGAAEGEDVTPQTVVVEVVDSSAMRISASVDEIDVLNISRGDMVRVTMDALSGRVLSGTITSIGSAATNNQGVVTFPLTITVDMPEGLVLPAGLSATAEVVIQEVTDVLLVPSQAIGGTLAQPTVRRKTANGVETVPVELGASDDFWVVVTSGLNEGETIVITVIAGNSSQQPGGPFTLPGRGFTSSPGIQFGGR